MPTPLRSAVTISLVPEARGGPFVFWDDLPGSIREAKRIGFDAVELFLPGPAAVPVAEVRKLVDAEGLAVAAVGTGAGWVIHKLQLCDPDPAQRRRAQEFIRSMIEFGAEFGAPAIIGSMQGRWGGDVDEPTARGFLADALEALGQVAHSLGTVLIYEPLNRYETNLCGTQAAGAALLRGLSTRSVRLLADLFHMNIEEVSLADGLRDGGSLIGHVHFVDSNRRPAGCGHIDYVPVVRTLHEVGYTGYLSAEAFPWPDPRAAAEKTRQTWEVCSRISQQG